MLSPANAPPRASPSTSLAVRSLPRREPPPSLRSGDYSRRELLDDGWPTSSGSAFDRGTVSFPRCQGFRSRRAKSPEVTEGGGARRGSEASARDQASGRGRIRPSRSPLRPKAQIARKRERRVSPDLAALGADHRVAGLAGEGAGEFLQVGRRRDCPKAAERVRIGVDDQPRELGPVVGGPDPGPGEKEPLVGRQAVDWLPRRLALEAPEEGAVGDRDPPEIGDGFSEDELAVLVEVPFDDVRVELFLDTYSAGLVVLQVLGRPPFPLVSLRVELAPGVVEAVRHLVADNGADAAVVDRVVGGGTEKRGLQDPGGKHDLVAGGLVVRVDRRRRHLPVHSVHGLADLGQVAAEFE